MNRKQTCDDDDTTYCPECKNESVACVCMDEDNES